MTDRDDMARRQRVLADFGEFALGSEDLDAVLTEACRLVGAALGTGRAKVLEIQAGGREMLVRAGVGWRSDVVGRLRLSVDEASSESYAIRAGRPVVCRDITEESRFDVPDFMRREGVRALANVPILVPGRSPYGLLQVDATEPRDFSGEDVEFLRTYATILGPVVDRLHKVRRLRESEAREREREHRFGTIFEAAPVGLGVIAPDGRFLRVNRELARILGRSAEALVALGVADVTDEPDIAPSVAAFRRCLETGEIASLDKRYRRPDGELVPASSSLTPLPMSDGSTGVLAVTVDLTARERAERALREREAEHRLDLERRIGEATAELKLSRDFLQAAFDASTDMIQIFEAVRDERGEIVDFNWVLNNHTSERRYGEVRGESLLARNPGVVAEGIFDAFKRVTETGTPEAAERRYVHEQFDGWFYQSAVRLGDGVATTTKDITDWKEAQAELLRLHEEAAQAQLRQSEERHRLILESALDYAIFTTDEDGLVTSWSPGAQAVFGWTEAEMIGQDVAITFTPEDRAAGDPGREMELARREGVAPNVRWHVRKDGRRIFIEGSTRPLRESGQGRRHGFIKIGQDITRRRETEQRQQVLLAELQHRTRNLLGVVRSMADRTASGVASLEAFLPRYRERLSALSRINALLSRLQHGERVTFDELIRTELGARGFLDEHMEARVALDGPAGVRLRSATVQTFALAIHELATNAAKYGALSGEAGRLAVSWRLRRDEAGLERLQVEWVETGVSDMPDAAAAPQGGGYGRMLIEKALPYQLGATTTYEFRPDGVRCTIDLPLR